MDHDGPTITRREIQDQFRARGWIDHRWSSPTNVINNAIRRATERYGWDDVGGGVFAPTDSAVANYTLDDLRVAGG